ncbi:Wzz/FepE/Etk N-terminal domain-containing protein [Tenacibaculum soleae]|uniref:Wzz/FepE/Etk N-terminal domain-containing protein n=1 Tax=Tenacibaculum soleae TaxID=447689 RepID=UPI0026E15A6C|nr:Wzz/FepE/Etk N-terminal domain-containing protein [Tenacibaculum soleae]MDO6743434.1 Wzz/FepE/Etk N-terminal domain-containing protein [Tenacibaculum soleae]
MENKNTYKAEDEIDLIALFKTIWSGKKTIIRFIVIFGLIGLFIAVFSAKEYTASVTLVAQTGGSKVPGNLGGLAAMAGINLGGGNEEGIPPSLYPKIVQSIPFQRELLQTPLNFSHIKDKVSYEEYYNKHEQFNLLRFLKGYTIGLPGKIIAKMSSPKPDDFKVDTDVGIYKISKEENILFKKLQEQFNVNFNKKDEYVELFFTMPEALASAQMTIRAQELLQKSITAFKIQKAKDEFEFIEERYAELKKDFERKQAALASYRDRNQGLITSRSQARLESLQSEYNLAFSIYSELAKQLETQKIKLKEDTPIFTVIDPVSVPVEKSKPRRLLVFVVWLFLGVVLGIVFVFVKDWLNNLK